MSKLVDKERLAKLAKALDQRAKAAVQAEKERAMAAESGIKGTADANTAAIAAINNAETGILKQAKDYADAIDEDLQKQIDNKVEVEAYNAKVKELEDADVVSVDNFSVEKMELLKRPVVLDGYRIRPPKVSVIREEGNRALLQITINLIAICIGFTMLTQNSLFHTHQFLSFIFYKYYNIFFIKNQKGDGVTHPL